MTFDIKIIPKGKYLFFKETFEIIFLRKGVMFECEVYFTKKGMERFVNKMIKKYGARLIK